MGKARYIYFRDQIDERLQSVGNKSELINNLLEDYFKSIELDDLSEEELEKELLKEKLKLEYETKLQEINKNGNN